LFALLFVEKIEWRLPAGSQTEVSHLEVFSLEPSKHFTKERLLSTNPLYAQRLKRRRPRTRTAKNSQRLSNIRSFGVSCFLFCVSFYTLLTKLGSLSHCWRYIWCLQI